MFDKGLTTFMIIATSLVMLMTPGLAFFYGGLGNKKNILNPLCILNNIDFEVIYIPVENNLVDILYYR